MLLLYVSRLPQSGDGAIGTLWVFLLAAALYLLTVILVVAALLMRVARPGHPSFHAGWLIAALALPLIVWLSLGVLV